MESTTENSPKMPDVKKTNKAEISAEQLKERAIPNDNANVQIKQETPDELEESRQEQHDNQERAKTNNNANVQIKQETPDELQESKQEQHDNQERAIPNDNATVQIKQKTPDELQESRQEQHDNQERANPNANANAQIKQETSDELQESKKEHDNQERAKPNENADVQIKQETSDKLEESKKEQHDNQERTIPNNNAKVQIKQETPDESQKLKQEQHDNQQEDDKHEAQNPPENYEEESETSSTSSDDSSLSSSDGSVIFLSVGSLSPIPIVDSDNDDEDNDDDVNDDDVNDDDVNDNEDNDNGDNANGDNDNRDNDNGDNDNGDNDNEVTRECVTHNSEEESDDDEGSTSESSESDEESSEDSQGIGKVLPEDSAPVIAPTQPTTTTSMVIKINGLEKIPYVFSENGRESWLTTLKQEVTKAIKKQLEAAIVPLLVTKPSNQSPNNDSGFLNWFVDTEDEIKRKCRKLMMWETFYKDLVEDGTLGMPLHNFLKRLNHQTEDESPPEKKIKLEDPLSLSPEIEELETMNQAGSSQTNVKAGERSEMRVQHKLLFTTKMDGTAVEISIDFAKPMH